MVTAGMVALWSAVARNAVVHAQHGSMVIISCFSITKTTITSIVD